MSQLTVQLARYVKVRGDLAVGWERIDLDQESGRRLLRAAKMCAEHLAQAREELQSRRPNLAAATYLLGLAERMLVTLYPPEFLRLRLHTVTRDLERRTPESRSHLAAVRHTKAKVGRESPDADSIELAQTVLRDAVSFLHDCEQREQLEDDLQVNRLNSALRYVCVALVALVLIVPLISTVQKAADGSVYWPIRQFGDGTFWGLFAGAGALATVGAVGGVISGMISVRDSKPTLADFRTSMKKLALRPAVGAVAALTLYLFLSSGVVNGVQVTNAGVYLVGAFAAGFSERYFLRIVSPQEEAAQPVAGDHIGAPLSDSSIDLRAEGRAESGQRSEEPNRTEHH